MSEHTQFLSQTAYGSEMSSFKNVHVTNEWIHGTNDILTIWIMALLQLIFT